MNGYSPLPLLFGRCSQILLLFIVIVTPLSNPFLNVWAKTSIEWITTVALTSFLLKCWLEHQWTWIVTPIDKPILAILCWCLLSSCFSIHRYTSFWTLFSIINYTVLFYLILHIFRTRKQIRRLVWTMISTAALVSIIGLIKKFGGNPFPWWHYEYMPGNAGQFVATFSNRNHLSGYMVSLLPLTLGFMISGYKDAKLFLLTGFLGLFLLTLLLCFSRSGWIASVCGIGLLCFLLLISGYYEKKRIFLFVFSGAILSIFLVFLETDLTRRILTISPDNLSGRSHLWECALDMIKNGSIWGSGPGTFKDAFASYHPPSYAYQYRFAFNEYLHLISETGVPSVVLILWLFSLLVLKSFHKIKHPSRLVRGITIGSIASVFALMVNAMANINFHLPAVAVNTAVLAALIVAPEPVSGSSG